MALNSVVIRCSPSIKNGNTIQQVAKLSAVAVGNPHLKKIGKREVVGFGFNGLPNYVDKIEFPMPAVRFKEVTPDIQQLREKEKGDWNNLNMEEKKALYRASFCQTFSEMKAPDGEWKMVLGITLIGISLGLWLSVLMDKFVYTPLPDSYKPENQQAQLKRMIDLRVNPVDGLASKWDYEKGRWKE